MTHFLEIFWSEEGLSAFPLWDRVWFGAVCLCILLFILGIVRLWEYWTSDPIVFKDLNPEE